MIENNTMTPEQYLLDAGFTPVFFNNCHDDMFILYYRDDPAGRITQIELDPNKSYETNYMDWVGKRYKAYCEMNPVLLLQKSFDDPQAARREVL
jgi:hypothetical protein